MIAFRPFLAFSTSLRSPSLRSTSVRSRVNAVATIINQGFLQSQSPPKTHFSTSTKSPPSMIPPFTPPFPPTPITPSTYKELADAKNVPMVWHQEYSIDWPSTHRFAMWKFGDLAEKCLILGLLPSSSHFYAPTVEASDAICVAGGHDAAYLFAFSSGGLSKEESRRIGFSNAPDLRKLDRRTRLEVSGTIETCKLAMEVGLAAHLGKTFLF